METNYTKADFARCGDPTFVTCAWDFVMCIDAQAALTSGLPMSQIGKFLSTISMLTHGMFHLIIGSQAPAADAPNASTGMVIIGDAFEVSTSPNEVRACLTGAVLDVLDPRSSVNPNPERLKHHVWTGRDSYAAVMRFGTTEHWHQPCMCRRPLTSTPNLNGNKPKTLRRKNHNTTAINPVWICSPTFPLELAVPAWQ